MTPKEKAKELERSFWPMSDTEISDVNSSVDCAMLCVEEILKAFYEFDMIPDFWVEVQKELEILDKE